MPQSSLVRDHSPVRTRQNCLFVEGASLRWNCLSCIVTVSRSLELLLTRRRSSFANQSYFSLVGEENGRSLVRAPTKEKERFQADEREKQFR